MYRRRLLAPLRMLDAALLKKPGGLLLREAQAGAAAAMEQVSVF